MFPTEILYMLASILVVTHTVSSHPHRDEINTSRHRRIRPAAGTVSRDALGELDSGQLDEARQAREQEILADRKLKLLRIEQIKMEILKKLGMTEAPNVTESFKRFPTPFLMSEERNSGFQATDGYLDEDDDSDYRAKTLQVSFFAENMSIGCHSEKPSACFMFRVTQDQIPGEIASVDLWVYQRHFPRPNLNITLVASEYRGRNANVGWAETAQKRGWIKMSDKRGNRNLQRAVQRWLQKPQRNNGLLVRCKTCRDKQSEEFAPIATEDNYRPVLVINLKSKRRRVPRSVRECNSRTSSCCRHYFEINFEEIGWHTWIIQPKKFTPYYCRGSCHVANDPLGFSHSKVMQSIAAHKDRDELIPCCTPTRYRAMSMLYIDGNVTKMDNLPNMIVERCGCGSM